MMINASKRTRAALLSLFLLAAAFATYLAVRPRDAAIAQPAEGTAPDGTARDRGRTLGSRLAAIARTAVTTPVESVAVAATHVAGPGCDRCTMENCVPGTDDGCDAISDAGDRKLCEQVYACFADPKNNCVIQGDPVRCWCGTNMTTCVTDNNGPTRANGPCLKEVLASAKTADADTIFHQFLNPDLPLGRAVRLTSCRGSFCSQDCRLP